MRIETFVSVVKSLGNFVTASARFITESFEYVSTDSSHLHAANVHTMNTTAGHVTVALTGHKIF